MFCCINCFDNEHIIEHIECYGDHGNCNYCKSHDLSVMDIEEMGEFIRDSLSKAYVNATTDSIPFHLHEDNAESITDVLRYSMCIFSSEIDSSDMCEKLIRDLFKSSAPSYRAIKQGDVDVFESGDAQIVLRDSFYAPDNNGFYHTWAEFKETVKHGNRFFDMNRNNSRENMLSVFNDFFEKMEIELKSGTLIWRARPNSGGPFEEIYDQTFECGPPPAEYAKSFRMNPDGISYFYGAEDKDTCIKEIRALETDDVVFGQFQTKRNLKLIDLSTVPNVTSPSVFSEDYDHDKIWARDFLQLFCTEISKPVDKETASIEYIPTQILTEYIRLKGYDGVCYNSSLTKKQNYTLFCGRASERTSYSFYYGMEPLVPNFKDWLELVNYEYVSAKSGEQS